MAKPPLLYYVPATRMLARVEFLVLLSVLVVWLAGTAVAQTKDEPAPATDTVVPEIVLLEGQVTDDMGRGQRGVAITVRTKSTSGKEGELIAETTTDDLGDFAVKVAKSMKGVVIVTLKKEQYSVMTRTVTVGADEYPPFLAESLEGALTLVGRVLDFATEKPVVGAAVSLESFDNNRDVKTNEKGVFTIKKVLPGPGELLVNADGYGRERVEFTRMEEFGEIPILLKPERVLHLRVRDDKAVPIAGVTIECNDEIRGDFRTAVTDEAGAATIRAVHFDAATLTVRLTHDAHVSDASFDREIITPEKDVESTHELVMQRAGKISGVARSAIDGAAMNGARVMTGGEYSDYSPRDWTDYEGHFTVIGVAPGDTVVTIHKSGFAPELRTVTVAAGEVTKLNFRMKAGAVLRGVVTDENDAPVGGADVWTTTWRGHTTLGLRAMTQANGTFAIDGAPHDQFGISVVKGRGEVVEKTVRADSDKLVAITIVAPVGRGPGGLSTVKVGDDAPKVELTTMTGEKIDLDKWKGKVVVLDFWATWCGPCVAELPGLKRVFEKFGSREDFALVSVSLDQDEKVLSDFIRKNRLGWRHVFGAAGGAPDAAEAYGVVGIPAMFLIGPDGKIVAADIGASEIAEKIEAIDRTMDRANERANDSN